MQLFKTALLSILLVFTVFSINAHSQETPETEELYKVGDKVEMWDMTRGKTKCEVTESNVNGYRKVRKYTLKCDDSNPIWRDITNARMRSNEAGKKAHEDDQKDIAKIEDEELALQKQMQPGLKKAAEDHLETQRLIRKANKRLLKKAAGE